MAEVKFISGDGVEHIVEETSIAAQIMRDHGFQQIGGPEPAAEEVVYTEADAIAQNEGGDVSAPAEPEAKKGKGSKK